MNLNIALIFELPVFAGAALAVIVAAKAAPVWGYDSLCWR
jgi:hypothetical protein